MIRKIAALTAGLLMAAVANTAVAAPDEPDPRTDAPDAVCTVVGQVTLDPGLNSTGVENHYEFIETSIICNSENPNLNTAFGVDAGGDTAGNAANGGEDCNEGFSASPGSITASGANGFNFKGGEVEFVRTESIVHAWGNLTQRAAGDPAGPGFTVEFDTHLQFTPLNPVEALGCIPGNPLNQSMTAAVLSGEARVYIA